MKSKIGLIGLATMGKNLARNIARNFHISVYNRTTEKTEEFIKEFGSEKLTGTKTLEEFVESLEKPRKIILMVKAGNGVDAVIDELTPLLDKGDIIIDGGNTHYPDTERRQARLVEKNIHLIGMGISGGEEGALNGPSMMPGGDKNAYESLKEILVPSSADDGDNGKCISYIGEGSSGHFVKMVHNGIEYGIMQLIGETYDILKNIGKLNNQELAETFGNWNKSRNSFLLEITQKIFTQKDEDKNKDLIDLIKDTGKQKGTGKWTSIAAYDLGVSTPTIHASVDARIMSGSIRLRSRKLPSKTLSPEIPDNLKNLVEDALELSTLCTYFQGLELMKAASIEKKWDLNLGEIMRIWRGGCIIRSDYLSLLQESENTKILEFFDSEAQTNWRETISLATSQGIPSPALSASLAYWDSIAKDKLPQNLTQAQRDFFGAHGYERIDKEGNFHTEW
ncbi:MAG: NADP-dependent phosphogluconate dehydrogenase [bacterium]|nr:NADP-dependent phosphogluconate dehydrogenase [bacterium]